MTAKTVIYALGLAVLAAVVVGGTVITGGRGHLLGTLLARTGRGGEAEPLLRDALRIRQAVLPVGHWPIEEAERCLAVLRRTLACRRPPGPPPGWNRLSRSH